MAEINDKIYYLDEVNECYVMREEIAVEYRRVMTEQLRLWKEGINKHSDQLGPDFPLPEGIEPECVPDMACCNGVRTSQEEKDTLCRLHAEGNHRAVEVMSFNFLEKALSEGVSGMKIHFISPDRHDTSH